MSGTLMNLVFAQRMIISLLNIETTLKLQINYYFGYLMGLMIFLMTFVFLIRFTKQKKIQEKKPQITIKYLRDK